MGCCRSLHVMYSFQDKQAGVSLSRLIAPMAYMADTSPVTHDPHKTPHHYRPRYRCIKATKKQSDTWVGCTTSCDSDACLIGLCDLLSMAQCKTAVTPLLMHWSYCSLALSHQSGPSCMCKYCRVGIHSGSPQAIHLKGTLLQDFLSKLVPLFETGTKPIMRNIPLRFGWYINCQLMMVIFPLM